MTTRILPVEEWPRLVGTELEGAIAILPKEAKVLVTEDGEDIVACLAVLPIMHVEGLWVAPSHRRNGVGQNLWTAMQRQLALHGVGTVVAGSVSAEMDGILAGLGGEQLPGNMFVLSVRG
jgi:ribosomal protein S18 acetylase RimI-like enzyme